jgi:hypothetical protein
MGKATSDPTAIAEWWGAECTTAYVPIGTPFYLLIQFWNDSGAPVFLNGCKLQWRESGGAWADIGTSSSAKVYVAPSSLVTDGAALEAAQLTPPGSSDWADGETYDVSTTVATAIAMNASGHQEFLWVCRFSKAATVGTAYEFGLDLVTDYTVTPTAKPWGVALTRRAGRIE